MCRSDDWIVDNDGGLHGRPPVRADLSGGAGGRYVKISPGARSSDEADLKSNAGSLAPRLLRSLDRRVRYLPPQFELELVRGAESSHPGRLHPGDRILGCDFRNDRLWNSSGTRLLDHFISPFLATLRMLSPTPPAVQWSAPLDWGQDPIDARYLRE